MRFRVYSLVGLAVISCNAAIGQADEHAAVEPYLTGDVSSVVYLDLGKLKLPAIVEELQKLHVIAELHATEAQKPAAAIQDQLNELIALGARRAYFLVRASELFSGGPTLVVEVAEERQAPAVVQWLAKWAHHADALGDAASYLPKAFVADGAAVIGAASPERVEQMRAGRGKSPRPEAVEALAALNGADVGWVGFGDADSRRVVRELFPQAPAPFTEIDGGFLDDGLKWLAVTAKLPPDPRLTVAVETTNGETATVLATAAEKALTIAKGFLMAEKLSGPPAHKDRADAVLPLLSLLKPHKEDTRLTVAFGDDEQELAFVRNFLPAISQKARDRAYGSQRMNNFKQIMLAMLNHESARGSLPTAAVLAKDGKPLLSWRVQILPYLEQGGLYNQFKLDEPWDSEHNRRLIDKMPDIYADSSPEIRAAIGDAGRTTFVVPTGEGLVFGGKEGVTYRAIKDGTSNTILLVEVPPGKAVVWTKPDDWEVDLEDPVKGLAREDREWFTAGYADGHVSIHSTKNEPGVLRSLLTPNGEENIDHASIK